MQTIKAQNWSLTGNSGTSPATNYIGTSDSKSFIFKTNSIERGRILSSGNWRFGTTTNYAQIDSAGSLTFTGAGAYKVGGNKYAFQYSGNPNYGLFFNSTDIRYEFRSSSASPVFYVNANSGNGVFNGTLKIGAYTLPSTDGTSGQVLNTDGAGNVSWATVSSGGGGANKKLSNLSGTNINESLLPDVDNTIDLGSIAKTWKNIYSSGAIYLYGTRFLANNGIQNTFTGGDAGLISTGSGNTATGWRSLYANTTGTGNTANGTGAMISNTSGAYNVAAGNSALYSNSTGGSNTAIGVTALYSNSTGYSNVAIGVRALFGNSITPNLVAVGDSALMSNTSGYQNTAIGSKSMYLNTTGAGNTATGYLALNANTIGSFNSSFGNLSLTSNTEGSENNAFGSGALYSNTTGNYNNAIGDLALFSNTVGTGNIAIGKSTLYKNTTGTYNFASGSESLFSNTTGLENTAIGRSTLINNTTGSYNFAGGSTSLFYNKTGSKNIAIGYLALVTSINNSGNIAIGDSALYTYNDGSFEDFLVAVGSKSLSANTTGFYNTSIGASAMLNNTTGTSNTAVGTFSMQTNLIGNSITTIGYSANVASSNLSNATAIGALAVVDASNKVRIGNNSITSIGGQVAWTAFSDGRYKKDIKENVAGLDFIKALRPITYTVDIESLDKELNKNIKPQTDQRNADLIKKNAGESAKIIHTGFIAQEVEAAAKKLNFDFDGVDKPQTKDGLYGLRYAEFVVPLVKAVQELSKNNDDKNEEIVAQNKKIDALQQQLDEMKNMLQQIQQCTPCANQNAAPLQSKGVTLNDNISLEQNIPNPFQQTTLIKYSLPQKYAQAMISITDKTGKVIKQVNISGSGKGQLTVDAASLSAGAYQYSLIVDGKLFGSKQMILAH